MIYEYKCKFCETVHDVEHGMNESPKVKCNICGTDCKKLITGGTGFILRGKGWYATDYKDKKKPKKEKDKEKKSNEKD